MLPKERPCDTCIHRKVCEAKSKYDEINVTVTHAFFTVKVECSQYFEAKPEPKTRIVGEIQR